jgi:hypothetical protein
MTICLRVFYWLESYISIYHLVYHMVEDALTKTAVITIIFTKLCITW